MPTLRAKDFPDALAPASNHHIALLRQGRAKKTGKADAARFSVTYAFEVHDERILVLDLDVAPAALGECACPNCLTNLIVDALVTAIVSDPALMGHVLKSALADHPIGVSIIEMLMAYQEQRCAEQEPASGPAPDRSLN